MFVPYLLRCLKELRKLISEEGTVSFWCHWLIQEVKHHNARCISVDANAFPSLYGDFSKYFLFCDTAFISVTAVKGKVKLSLCLTKYHAMKMHLLLN
jgi:hypothetical protein